MCQKKNDDFLYFLYEEILTRSYLITYMYVKYYVNVAQSKIQINV